MKKVLLIVLAMLSLVACEKKSDVETPIDSPTITQGIYGLVKERYGNWQPVFSSSPSLGCLLFGVPPRTFLIFICICQNIFVILQRKIESLALTALKSKDKRKCASNIA